MKQMDLEVRELALDEYKIALQLSLAVFGQFEAPDYSEQGVERFHAIVHDPGFVIMLRMYGAFEDGDLVGMLATRGEGEHIALFFVDGRYHRKGVGRRLFERACGDNRSGVMTVNSSPYAVGVYRRLGFTATDTEQTVDGIRFTPMRCELKREYGRNRQSAERGSA